MPITACAHHQKRFPAEPGAFFFTACILSLSGQARIRLTLIPFRLAAFDPCTHGGNAGFRKAKQYSGVFLHRAFLTGKPGMCNHEEMPEKLWYTACGLH